MTAHRPENVTNLNRTNSNSNSNSIWNKRKGICKTLVLLVNKTHTYWVLNPRPHPPNHYYGKKKCRLSHTLTHRLEKVFVKSYLNNKDPILTSLPKPHLQNGLHHLLFLVYCYDFKSKVIFNIPFSLNNQFKTTTATFWTFFIPSIFIIPTPVLSALRRP